MTLKAWSTCSPLACYSSCTWLTPGFLDLVLQSLYSKMIFRFAFFTCFISGRALWIATQVTTQSTTITLTFSILVPFTPLLSLWSPRFFIDTVCIFFSRFTLLSWDIWCSTLSHCSASSIVRTRVSSSLSSSNLSLISDPHLHRTASLIWLPKSAPKLPSFPSFLNRVSNCKTVSRG